MKIKLTTIQEVQDFVKIANTQLPHRLYASQERYTVDAKSIMCLFSLDLPNPVELYSDEVSDLSVFNMISQKSPTSTGGGMNGFLS